MKIRLLLALGALLAAAEAAQPGLPIRATFTGSQQTYSWRLEDLDPALPADWSEYTHLVLEWRASHSQRFELGLETDRGRIAKRIGPFAGVWVRASIPLRFYREPAGQRDRSGRHLQPAAHLLLDQHRQAGGRGPTDQASARHHAHDERPGRHADDRDARVVAGQDRSRRRGARRQAAHRRVRPIHPAEWPGKAHSLDESEARLGRGGSRTRERAPQIAARTAGS